jgi:HD-GYP domain-containing protein (c-di-GMP phosphodiesterase class II)
MLVGRLGLGGQLRADLGQVYERWDGKGMPHHLAGDELSLPMRVVHLAEIADLYWRIGGDEAAQDVVRARAGGALDPTLALRFGEVAGELLAVLDQDTLWDEVQHAEPLPRRMIADSDMDTALGVMADFADLKSPYTLGHSSGVGVLAEAAAQRCGMLPADVTALHRAGLVQDIGRVSVPAAVWIKKGALSHGEWEQVRLHTYHGERVLAPAPSLAPPGGCPPVTMSDWTAPATTLASAPSSCLPASDCWPSPTPMRR